MRDGTITALDDGQTESLWVAEHLGHRVVKAWNAIIAGSFDARATPPGTIGRIAIPVAAGLLLIYHQVLVPRQNSR